MIAPASIGTLFKHAATLLVRRWPLYLAGTIVAFGVEATLFFAHGLNPIVATVVGDVFALAPLAAIVYGFGGADSTASPPSGGAFWGRIAERVWAVIVIQAALDLFFILLVLAVGPSVVAQTIAQVGFLILGTILAFAQIHAIWAPEERPARLLLDSLLASARITTTRIGYIRAVGLVFVPYLLQQTVAQSLWENLILVTLIQVPFAALTVACYLDCLALGRDDAGK